MSSPPNLSLTDDYNRQLINLTTFLDNYGQVVLAMIVTEAIYYILMMNLSRVHKSSQSV